MDNFWPDGTPEEDQPVWCLFLGRCVRCLKMAVCLHELVPKSLAPKLKTTLSNRVPVCNECHEWAQRNTKKSAPILLAAARTRIQSSYIIGLRAQGLLDLGFTLY